MLKLKKSEYFYTIKYFEDNKFIEYDEELKRDVSIFDGTSNYIPIGKVGKVTNAITINVLAYIDIFYAQ